MTPSLDLWLVLSCTLAAGLAMPLGACLAMLERLAPAWIQQELRHSVMAFGGGALMSAVSLVLVPEGSRHWGAGYSAIWFCLGGCMFMGLDVFLAKHKAPAAQLVAMLSDFLPESIALGATFAWGGNTGFLLAGLMALQNAPEGFNAYREMAQDGRISPRRLITYFSLMALLGPMMGSVGYFWMAGHKAALGATMLVASGGILYSVFQDIAPQSRLERHWGPPMGAVVGFVLGLVGHLLTQNIPGS